MSDSSNNLIEIEHLFFHYGEKVIYDDFSFGIPRGKITALMGPSGTGKTTLLRLIGGELQPDSGKIIVDGLNISTAKEKALYAHRLKMGILFQQGALFTDLTVFENVAFALRAHYNLPEDMLRDIVLMKLNAVGLRGAHQLMPSELSGGMARRVALARAIVTDPSLMLYDEPFTGQDPISRGVLLKLIRELNDVLGMTSLLVSHDVTESVEIADYVLVVAGGKLIGAGTPDEILNHPDPAIEQFIHGRHDGEVPFHYPTHTISEDLHVD